MAEIQAFLIELTPDVQHVRRESAGVMFPVIEGQLVKRGQLPLQIRIASREAD